MEKAYKIKICKMMRIAFTTRCCSLKRTASPFLGAGVPVIFFTFCSYICNIQIYVEKNVLYVCRANVYMFVLYN